MNTQKTLNRSLKFIAKVILGFIVGITLGFGITKLVKTNYRLTSSIEKTIQQNCDCESVEKNISAMGIQFSKKDGASNQTASFTLSNCKYESSAIEEAHRINKHLKTAVENYDSVNIIELTFRTNGEEEVVKITNETII